MRRMDRYQEENNPRTTRLDKNKDLYQNVNSRVAYTNITDVKNANAIDLNSIKDNNNRTTREAYQTMQRYQNIEPISRERKELEDLKYVQKQHETKIYDINSFLEEARKNRQGKDELDNKRKLKNNSYNILAGINRKELEKYREEKKKRLLTPEEEEIHELMDTIASKTLAGEIDKETTVDLLSDLMATSMLDKVKPSGEITSNKEDDDPKIIKKIEEEKIEIEDNSLSVSKQIIDIKDIKELEKNQPIKEEKDSDFYSKSMDLSEADLEMSNEFKEKSLPLIVKIIIVLLILAVIAVAGYFIYQRI